ncbi:Fanconi anemia group M protein [Heterocephalus glaber]|uniref:Fanconi anemia group M protein n=1 Tax=Heterocephalus glaber TaxID=10181 RepID=G5BUQ8_HETGA|nr:Fanconi anemia group M protein [Heterocephalus glaber]
MSGRQRTLFQTWGSSVSRSAGAPGGSSGAERPQGPGSFKPGLPAAAEAQPESDDDVLLVAVYEAEQRQQRQENGGFCTSAGALWIYPTNCPVRDYQLHISRTALFCNTLVCLPTGLGKTFIAAVVMYNFYRWFPSGKVVFMAPTKPLVTQQIEACYQVMGIPQAHMAEMTGSTQAFTRKEIWLSKRVLFLTPQVMVNDLTRGACPAADIKCLVVDEAHKALGNYAYCQVVRELIKYTNHFRILALSATPGSDIKAVQQVITNLLIGQIELRSEDSADILPYSHERRVEKLIVPLGEELAAIQKTYIQASHFYHNFDNEPILESFASPLIHRNVLMRRDISNLTKYQIILARDQFRKNPSPNIVGIQQGIIEGEFAVCISLYHGYELLQQMGMRSLYFFLCGIMDGTKGDKDKTFCYSHPKLKKLEEVVVEHFKSWNAQNSSGKKCDETRVMIFSSFRDSVQEIAEMLLKHKPIIRVMTFVGHASGKSMKGFTQKEQLEVVKQFRDGGYNTLVSTCVGEEGLDIGEVDLIICFDAQRSPIRLIQRMGRTGRKRQGRIVVILAEGREERTYNQSQSNKRSIYKAISGSKQVLHFYQRSPRMVPDDINPELHKMFITHGIYKPEKSSRSVKRKSSLFSCRNGMRQNNSNKDWFLSEEEFKLWNRLYRLRNSDKIKEITLPRVHFPSLQEEENGPIQKPTTGIHELSLGEWRVWQDHPFPTHQVDHSERCHHFVSVMQMIERMRHEEGESNYELEMKSYLQMEDVSSTFSTLGNGYSNPANDIFITHEKSSLTKNINQANSFSMIESDEECAENFKQTHIKPTKIVSLMKTASKETKKDQSEKENNGDTDFLNTGRTSPVEPSFQIDLPDDKKSSDIDGVATTCTVNKKVINQPDVSLTEGQFTNKSINSFAVCFLDSGYGSCSDEKSALSNLFLPFEEELYISRTSDRFHHCHTLTKEVLANVERFLSHSPPPLSRLSDLEFEMTELENLPFLPHTEHLQNCKPTSLMSCSAVDSQQNLELDSLKIINQPSEKSCLFITNNAKTSDEPYLFDRDDKVHNNIKNENLLCNSHVPIHVDPSRNLVDKTNHDDGNNDFPILSTDQNESLLLFEDVDGEFNDDQKNSEIDSPVHAVKKHRVRRSELSSSDESENIPYLQLEDFKNCNRNTRRGIKVQNGQSHQKHVARMFLDDEAELSEEDAKCISSDESDDSENEPDSSMLNFLNDETQLSQAVNDSEMRAIYMKSLHSPLMSNKYKMVHKKHRNINIFSQIPEQDETYLEDSFCVDEEESCKNQSSEEEICVDFNLITEDCFSSESKKYTTRRAVMLKQMKMQQNCARSKKKLSRIILPDDSSEEENSVNDKRESDTVGNSGTIDKNNPQEDPLTLMPAESSVQLKVLSNLVGHALEDPSTPGAHCSNSGSHVAEPHTSLRFAPEEKRTCVLVASREITSGFQVISSLRAVHGFHVEVCPLNGCDYIVSNRMVVERRCQSEMLSAVNKNKLIEQIQHLQSMFERICVIVEKDREKTGDTSRMFRRTKSYDSLLTTLIGAGIRILFSSCQEETADLLKELSLVEQRKNVGIHVPTVVNSGKCEALQFYLSIPNISYIAALNMCHQFSSVKKMANSSPEEISMYAQVTHRKAEEIYRYIHYVFDMQMLPNDLNQDRLKSDT